MRDIVITLLVFGSLPIILYRPYIGVLVWSWLSYMNPHKLTWGFAFDMPYAQIVAITLFAAILLAREKLNLPRSNILFFWIIFLIWMLFTTMFAVYPEQASVQLVKVLKIQLVTLLTLVLFDDLKKLNQLVWVIALSIGYYSIKGGIFSITSGGGFRVWGPPTTFIEDNNALAVASLMIVPLLLYLYHIHKETAWLRLGLAAGILLSIVSVIGSQSRGAAVAILAVGVFYWLKTKTKVLSGILIVVIGSMIFSFMPDSWHQRMDTIANYQQDDSAMGRINAWIYSINAASDRLTGAGFESWEFETFARWAPDPRDVHAAHSIYFGVLADHGWPGLILFLVILFLTWRSLSNTIRQTKNNEEYTSQNMLARMLQVSLIAYMSGGAFLSLAYFDLPWHIVAISILLAQQLERPAFTSLDSKGIVEAGYDVETDVTSKEVARRYGL